MPSQTDLEDPCQTVFMDQVEKFCKRKSMMESAYVLEEYKKGGFHVHMAVRMYGQEYGKRTLLKWVQSSFKKFNLPDTNFDVKCNPNAFSYIEKYHAPVCVRKLNYKKNKNNNKSL